MSLGSVFIFFPEVRSFVRIILISSVSLDHMYVGVPGVGVCMMLAQM